MVVGIHDVAPPFEEEIRSQLEALSRAGVDRVTLKVVPCWHGRTALSASPTLIELLSEHVTAGSQLVLHGFQHRPRGPWLGSPIRRTRARLFARSAAEFMTLSGPDAASAVRSGMAELRRCGLPPPDTFCAPGWLITDEAESAIAEAGMRYLVGMFSIQDLQERRLQWLPSFGHMGAGPLHELGIHALGRLVSPIWNRTGRVQVYLHPESRSGGTPGSDRRAGVRFGPDWMRTVQAVEALRRNGWEPVTFRDLMDGHLPSELR